MSDILDRGTSELSVREVQRAEGVQRNIVEGRQQVLHSFVFRFYHDTMLDTHLAGFYHKFGPNSPTPAIRPVVEPHSLGGGYHGVPWEFEWDGIRWRAEFDSGYGGGWRCEFYVYGRQKVRGSRLRRIAWTWLRRTLRMREWQIVHTPGHVVEALS